MINKIVMDCAHVMVNELFSYSAKSESIWKTVVREINKKYGIIVSKEDILPGYLLGGIVHRNGIDCFFKTPLLDREREFFVNENTIPREFLIKFVPKVRRYDLEAVSPAYARIYEILETEPSPENFEDLVEILRLRANPIPSFCQPLHQ